jgi:hypothetical protein
MRVKCYFVINKCDENNPIHFTIFYDVSK